jgi:hypothetical protein
MVQVLRTPVEAWFTNGVLLPPLMSQSSAEHWQELLCVALVGTDVSEELSASFIRVFLRTMRRLLVTASVPSSPTLVTLMKEALSSSEKSVLTRATRPNIPEDTILHSHRRENLKSCNSWYFSFLFLVSDILCCYPLILSFANIYAYLCSQIWNLCLALIRACFNIFMLRKFI